MPKYNVERTIQIEAEPSRVFETLADYRTWTTWSPWLIADPAAKVTVSSNPNSVGSTYRWEGELTGEGRIEHKQLEPYRLIDDELTFIKPFKSVAKTTLCFRPEYGGTHVTWSMNGHMPWFLFWMIPIMKTFIGMDYARGLTMIKEWIETGTIQSKTIVHGIETVGSIRMAGISSSCSIDEISRSMEQA
jgi:hypothetical protein